MKRLIKIALTRACQFMYILGTLIEAPIYLWNNRRLFENKIIYVFWHWSIGHTTGGIDHASRLYFPHRISLIYIPHEGSNNYLPFCFSHNVDVFVYASRLLPRSEIYDGLKRDTLRFLLLLLSGLTRRFEVIEHSNIYKTVSLAEGQLLMGNNEKGILERYHDWTGYLRLLQSGIGRKPQFPREMEDRCRQDIQRCVPDFFDKPFITLLLRGKGDYPTLGTSARCSGPQENYLPLVRFLTTEGYYVVGTGQTRHDIFRDIPGYLSLEDTHLPSRLLNLFMIMHCALLIGQDSGPLVLAAACEIPCLATDIPFYRTGPFRRDDIVLFKHLQEKSSGRLISIVEAYRQHQDLVYGYHFNQKGIEILPNTPEELLEAGKEMSAIIHGKMIYSDEDRHLIEAFRALPEKSMMIHYQGTRTSIHVLRQLKGELEEAMNQKTAVRLRVS